MPPAIRLLSLPDECLELILDSLIDKRTQTLFSLLTVCKRLFNLSVRQLYYDPLRSLNDLPSLSYSENTETLFLRCIARLSPEIKGAMEYLGCIVDEEPIMAPYIDYLSFVRVFRLSSIPENLRSSNDMRALQSLIWGVCVPRLPHVHAISLPCRSLDTWKEHIPAMIHITTVEFVVQYSLGYDMKDTIIPQIQEAVTFTKNLLEARRAAGVHTELDVQLFSPDTNNPFWHAFDFWRESARELYALGSAVGVTSIKDKTSPDVIRYFADPPGKLDISRLHTFHQDAYVQHLYLSTPRNYDRCIQSPCLQSLRLNLVQGDDYVFDWAVGERRRVLAAQGGSNHQPHIYGSNTLPSIRSLSLIGDRNFHLMPDTLRDAIEAFGGTLIDIHVKDGGGSSWRSEFPSTHGMKLLSVYKAQSKMRYSPSSFAICTNLKTLDICDDRQISYKTKCVPMEPWILAKTLTTLCLRGLIAFEFNQESFTSFADGLQHLEFSCFNIPLRYPPNHWVLNFFWDLSQWNFPSLRSIKLDGEFARKFEFSMLLQCPAIESVELCWPDPDHIEWIPLCESFFTLTSASCKHLRVDNISSRNERMPPQPPAFESEGCGWTQPIDSEWVGLDESVSLTSGSCKYPIEGEDDGRDTADGYSRKEVSIPLHNLCIEGYFVPDDILENVIPSLFPKLTSLSIVCCRTQCDRYKSDVMGLYPSLKSLVWEAGVDIVYVDPYDLE